MEDEEIDNPEIEKWASVSYGHADRLHSRKPGWVIETKTKQGNGYASFVAHDNVILPFLATNWKHLPNSWSTHNPPAAPKLNVHVDPGLSLVSLESGPLTDR